MSRSRAEAESGRINNCVIRNMLVVNGNNAGWVSYPAARWDGWAEATVNVTLRAGGEFDTPR
ncbi:hypothetical protein OG394_09965 [Kribbella sp. NBC_01245]|uniref:hypothetical protein n=1 Tax=Kribbella sp. NBC_01245 TaxID=2903578 RepID=UPI002E2C5EF6|nr:hypothetical protein [Kribbella sp. NBC_01245]